MQPQLTLPLIVSKWIRATHSLFLREGDEVVKPFLRGRFEEAAGTATSQARAEATYLLTHRDTEE